MINKEDVYKIGKITKAHGLKGEVVFVFDDDIFDRQESEYLICEIDGILVPFFMEEYRFRSDSSALVTFEDIDSIEKTEQIVGSDVYFERKKAFGDEDINDNENEDGEYSLYYFVGFTIMDGETEVGKIDAIDDKTDNWLFITEDGSLIPANEDFITGIDIKKKIITMNLPLGLLELNK